MSETASMSTGIAARYATAMFDLASDGGAIDALAADTDALAGALSDSPDFRDLLSSPVYSRDETEAAIGAIASAMGLNTITANTLRLMAQKRRLFVVPALVSELRDRIAEHRGEMTADVVSAKPLTQAQSTKLAATLKAAMGKEITLNASVDDDLIGGLVVKVGSKMIDTSIRSKLNALQNSMKEVG